MLAIFAVVQYSEISPFLFVVVVSADGHLFLAKNSCIILCMVKRINRTSALSTTAKINREMKFRSNARLGLSIESLRGNQHAARRSFAVIAVVDSADNLAFLSLGRRESRLSSPPASTSRVESSSSSVVVEWFFSYEQQRSRACLQPTSMLAIFAMHYKLVKEYRTGTVYSSYSTYVGGPLLTLKEE
jgi:hypothetical protein